MTQPKVLLLAAGGHGRVVLDALLCQGVRVHGVLDPRLKAGELIMGVPALGTDQWLDTQAPGSYALANGAGATPMMSLRRKLFMQWSDKGFAFAGARHPSAVVGRDVSLATDCQLMAGTVIQTGTSIGANSVVNTRASIDHDCQIGRHVFVGPGAVLCGAVHLGTGSFIGAGAVLLPGVRIGEGAVVGAGATVTRDVPDGQVVMGCPATARS